MQFTAPDFTWQSYLLRPQDGTVQAPGTIQFLALHRGLAHLFLALLYLQL